MYVAIGVDSCVGVGVDSCVGVVDSFFGVAAFSLKPSAAPPKCLLPVGVTASDFASALPITGGKEVSDKADVENDDDDVDDEDEDDDDDDDDDDGWMALEAALTSS